MFVFKGSRQKLPTHWPPKQKRRHLIIVKSESGKRRVMSSPPNYFFELRSPNTVWGTQWLSTALTGADHRLPVKISHRKILRKKVSRVFRSQATIQASTPREQGFRKLGFLKIRVVEIRLNSKQFDAIEWGLLLEISIIIEVSPNL